MNYVSLYSNQYSSDITMTFPLNECYKTSGYFSRVDCSTEDVNMKYYHDDRCVDYTGLSDNYNVGSTMISAFNSGFKVTKIICGHDKFDVVRAAYEPSEYEFNRLSLFLIIGAGALFVTTVLFLIFWLCRVGYRGRISRKGNRVSSTEEMI